MKMMISFLTVIFVAGSAMAAKSTITRDEKYIYIKTPLAISFDQQQADAIKKATAALQDQLKALAPQNPRANLASRIIDDSMIQTADVFEKSVDKTVDFVQKYYSSMVKYNPLPSILPTGFVIYGGVQLSANMALGGSGSVMLGIVCVPMHVKVIDIDTREVVSEGVTLDSSLVVFPSANFGVGVGGGANGHGGIGLIFGDLEKSADFAGLLTGLSGSYAFGVGNNFKIQTLKNWNKPGAVNNVLITGALESGVEAKADIHASVSYVINAQNFFKGASGLLSGIGNRLGITDYDSHKKN
jgi:hypothetical protein